jgi:hypothetical protein
MAIWVTKGGARGANQIEIKDTGNRKKYTG